MKLESIIKNTKPKSTEINHTRDVTDLIIDSREVKKDSAFIAIRGSKVDGHNYINEAIKNGATNLILEEVPRNISIPKDINLVLYDDTQEILGYLANNFYDHPSTKLKVIAITGTKGKTTVANMLKDALESQGHTCGISGTLGINYNNKKIESPNTTPDSLLLQKAMRKMVDDKCEYFIMEASSQGFKRKRINGIDIDIGVFLNIDRDHIGENEHSSFEEYLSCKLEIFDKSKKVIVNSGDKLWNYLTPKQIEDSISFSVNSNADFKAINIKPYKSNRVLGSTFEIEDHEGSFIISLPGQINVQNALATLTILDQLGFDINEFNKSFSSFKVQGRAELLQSPAEYNRTVLADFAHNRLSTQSILENLRDYNPKRIISVFGLRWNETKMRRYDQGYSAGKFSDLAILTEDYRGSESFKQISEDVIKGLNDSGGKYIVIEDRKEALEKAADLINEDDILILLGIDNSHIQMINDKKIYFNEEEIIYNYLKNKNNKQ